MFAYSESAGTWVAQPAMADGPLPVAQLRVLTYNVWFDAYEGSRRCDAILQILERERADVMVLEEVTQPFLDALRDSAWVRAQYALSQHYVDPTLRYDVVMLSRLPVQRFTAHTLTSIMGRRLHVLELSTCCGSLRVAGIHLESMKEMRPTRLTQIDECLPVLAASDGAIWLGDFNAAPDTPEDARIRARFEDAWDTLDPSPGYTRDTTRNTMLARIKDDRHQRIDRVFFRGPRLKPVGVHMIGTSPVEGSDGQVFPSDHFGVVADFSCDCA
jgi:poly(A) polymerase